MTAHDCTTACLVCEATKLRANLASAHESIRIKDEKLDELRSQVQELTGRLSAREKIAAPKVDAGPVPTDFDIDCARKALNADSDSFDRAQGLECAFMWHMSEQGFEFWRGEYLRLRNGLDLSPEARAILETWIAEVETPAAIDLASGPDETVRQVVMTQETFDAAIAAARSEALAPIAVALGCEATADACVAKIEHHRATTRETLDRLTRERESAHLELQRIRLDNGTVRDIRLLLRAYGGGQSWVTTHGHLERAYPSTRYTTPDYDACATIDDRAAALLTVIEELRAEIATLRSGRGMPVELQDRIDQWIADWMGQATPPTAARAATLLGAISAWLQSQPVETSPRPETATRSLVERAQRWVSAMDDLSCDSADPERAEGIVRNLAAATPERTWEEAIEEAVKLAQTMDRHCGLASLREQKEYDLLDREVVVTKLRALAKDGGNR